MARIHYWELSNCNRGELIGKWFNLDDVTLEEHNEEIQEWLDELTESTGELCEEWIVGDVEGVDEEYVGEWSIDDSYFEIMELCKKSGIGEEAFMAGINCSLVPESIREAYQGKYDCDESFAIDYLESSGELNSDNFLSRYFDTHSFSIDLMNDYIECDGHYFSTYC